MIEFKDKNTIINEMVMNTYFIMKAKLEYNEILIECFKENKKFDQALIIENLNANIKQAMETIYNNAGCWA